jgi:hypothetical protein
VGGVSYNDTSPHIGNNFADKRTDSSWRKNITEINKLINSIWNEEELLDLWKESIIVPIHKKSDKTDCNNYLGISLLPTSYKLLSIIPISRLNPYTDIITGECGF